MTDLDKSLRDLIAAHGLLSVSVDAHAGSGDYDGHFSVGLQWSDPYAQHGRGCVIGSGDSTQDALKNALATMAEKRAPALVGELAMTDLPPIKQLAESAIAKATGQ